MPHKKKKKSTRRVGRQIKSGSSKGQRIPRSKKVRPSDHARKRATLAAGPNPERVLIGAKAEKLFYEGGEGKPPRSRWVHDFETHVRVWGLPNGNVLLEAADPSLSLWENMDVTIK